MVGRGVRGRKTNKKTHHSSFEVPPSVFVFNFFSGKVETKTSFLIDFLLFGPTPGVLNSKLPGHTCSFIAEEFSWKSSGLDWTT
jgi:hypothetical protein